MNVLMFCIFSHERVESDMFFDKKHEDFFSSENRWEMVTVGEHCPPLVRNMGLSSCIYLHYIVLFFNVLISGLYE